MTPLRILVPSSMAVLLATGYVACQPKPNDAAVQAQVAAQMQAKAAEDRVGALEQQVNDMKAGKSGATGDQEAVNQMAAAHLRALDRQLNDARQRAADRRREAETMATTPVNQRPTLILVEVPAGTRLTVNLGSELSTDRDQPGDPWSGTLAEDVLVGNTVAWAAGTTVSGVVAQSMPAGRLSSGNGGLGIRLTTVGRSDVDAGTYMVVGDNRGKRDAKFIGGTAALGALVSALLVELGKFGFAHYVALVFGRYRFGATRSEFRIVLLTPLSRLLPSDPPQPNENNIATDTAVFTNRSIWVSPMSGWSVHHASS